MSIKNLKLVLNRFIMRRNLEIHKTDNKKQTFRNIRMEKSVRNFLNGKSRRAYSLREDIARGLKGAQINPSTNQTRFQTTTPKTE